MTPPTPSRDTPAGAAFHDLRNLARRHGRDVAEYLTLYALEGALLRVARSTSADRLILKGGVLMAALAARRPTRDIDLAAVSLPADPASLTRIMTAILLMDVGDGLVFDIASISGEPIREDASYPGFRIKITAHLASARVPLHIDLSIGDPISPHPVQTDLPLLLGGHVRLASYPLAMVLSEKLLTAVDRGAANTRWRDFVDIDSISANRTIDGSELVVALSVVARHRGIVPIDLTTAVGDLGTAGQAQWSAWRRRQQLTASTPESLTQLLQRCAEVADPVLRQVSVGVDHAERDLQWDHASRTWRAER